jgi:tripartite-type tricarboxylate transporter receptor subunit TctC
MKWGITRCVAVMSFAAMAMTGVAAAQDFYSGKQVKIIVSSASGGGYDQYARMLARYMPKYLPGNPSMIVVNMPGAGGVIAANHLFNIAEKDGTVIGTLNRFSAVMPILGVEQARYKTEEFNWLGTTTNYADNSYLVYVRSALPHKSIDDLRDPKKEVNFGVSTPDVPAVLKEALGLNFRIITGYKGQTDVQLAIERGELDANVDGYISMQAEHPDWLEKKFVRPLIQFGRVERHPAFPDVPTARELARTAEDRALIEFAEAPMLMARPFAAPPGVPKERVELLRAAFMKTMKDPDYLAEVQRTKAEHAPTDGRRCRPWSPSLPRHSPMSSSATSTLSVASRRPADEFGGNRPATKNAAGGLPAATVIQPHNSGGTDGEIRYLADGASGCPDKRRLSRRQRRVDDRRDREISVRTEILRRSDRLA